MGGSWPASTRTMLRLKNCTSAVRRLAPSTARFCSGKTSTNVYKDGNGDVSLMKPEEAPDWLADKFKPRETLEELLVDEKNGGYKTMEESRVRRLLKLYTRNDIKRKNELTLL